MTAARPVVVMGVSGCGKSTLGRALAAALGYRFVEGDLLHPEANVRKMAAGEPLTDADRAPFLEYVAAALAEQPASVASCSALKRAYRDLIRVRAGAVTFVLPDVPRALLMDRMRTREGHFMPVSLLDSQLATLEPPTDEERAVVVAGDLPLADQVAIALDGIARVGTSAII